MAQPTMVTPPIPKRVLVTGGSGFIGTNVVETCLANGYAVVNLDVNPPKAEAHTSCWWQSDNLEKDTINNIMRKFRPDIIIQHAARTGMEENEPAFFTANWRETENIRNAASENNFA